MAYESRDKWHIKVETNGMKVGTIFKEGVKGLI